MMDLGLAHGIRLRFEDGLLDAILLDLHRKPKITVREELLGGDVRPEALAPARIEGTVAQQDLGIGRRELEISESRNGRVVATLSQRFELRTPIEWRLKLGTAGKLDQKNVTFDLPDKVSMTVQTAAPYVLEPGGLRVSLPAGSTEITLTVTSQPVFAVSETIIVCRPDQMREAAIVASCLPARHFIPILGIDLPPMTKQDYIAQYNKFSQSQDDMMSQVGGTIGRKELSSADKASKLRLLSIVLDMQEQRSSLTPYRSWAKRNLMLSSLISELGVKRAIFLHKFMPDELVAIDPGPEARRMVNGEEKVTEEQSQMFEGIPEKLDLSGTSLSELSSDAWRLLHGDDSSPEQTIEVSADSTENYLAALFVALKTGSALRAVEKPAASVQTNLGNLQANTEEAVLVEDTGDVTALLGVLYAHHRSARLVITPRPDVELVKHVVSEHQRKVVAAARAAVDDACGPDFDFASALHRYLSKDGHDPHADVVAAVTAQVPLDAINEVNGSRLTAFTTGLPYSFVHTSEADWANKPIGHVAGDADLLILNEIYSAGLERPAGAFSLIYDPGFFKKSETGEVMRSVGKHFTHPILLSGEDANQMTLMRYPEALPVELIFFNTHGSDNQIVLAHHALSSSLIVQWLRLDHRPIVFNNSCQSWTGVGQEFVRVGARGYIGTLWSIPSDLAADFARMVIERLTLKEELACEAILNTGLSDIIERSYIYAGTANGRLDQWRDRATPLSETALRECALLAGAIDVSHGDLVDLVNRPLRREIHALRILAEGTPYEWSLLNADAMVYELSLMVQQDLPNPKDVEAAFVLADKIDKVLERSDGPQEQIARRSADRFSLTGGLYQRFNAWPEALRDYGRSIAYGDACRNRANLLIQMASISMLQGKREEALKLAQSSYDEFKDKQNRSGLMVALGLLGQLNKRLGRLDDAMIQVKEGYMLAVELQNRDEQSVFKLDESFIHELNGDIDAAIAAAAKALELSRINRNDSGELSAVGKLGVLYRQKGDLEAALRYAVEGLAQSERLAIPKETGTFHLDIAFVLAEKGHYTEALPHYREAVMILGNVGSWELGDGALAALAHCAHQIDDVEALWLVAIWGSQFCEMLEQHQWVSTIPIVVIALKRAIQLSSPEALHNGMQKLASITLSDKPQEQPNQMRFLGSITFLFWKWIENGDHAEVVELARHLDNQTGGQLELEQFVAVPFGGRT
jgi:tetratricopeptide (TPR) repeat protein